MSVTRPPTHKTDRKRGSGTESYNRFLTPFLTRFPAREMAEMLARVATAPDPGVLLGLEGQAAAVYFANFGRMLKAKTPGATFDFTTRNRRPLYSH